MREFRQLDIDLIDPTSAQPRRTFPEASLHELAASVRRHGVLQPILVRPNGERFTLVAGERRLRAAKLADCKTIPGRVLDVDEAAADEATIVENLHREDIQPLDEGESYQRLLAAGRTIEELAARLGKSKAYLYKRVSLTRLVPRAQDLLARDILPLSYALKIATVPAERQSAALERCFRPLFRDEEARRDQLEPLAHVSAWIEKTVRLDPRGEDAAVLLPELAEQVVSAEQEHHASVLALSTLLVHTDRRDPKPILAKSWKAAEGKERCKHARPGVILLGDRQGTFLQVCVAKKACQKHWPRPSANSPTRTPADRKADEARQRQHAEWEKRQAEAERWRKDLRPRAVRLIAEQTSKLAWSPMLLRLLLEEIGNDDLFRELVGKPQSLQVRCYPQAVAVALAIRKSWQRDACLTFAKRLGVKLSAKALSDQTEPDASDAGTPEASPDRPHNTARSN